MDSSNNNVDMFSEIFRVYDKNFYENKKTNLHFNNTYNRFLLALSLIKNLKYKIALYGYGHLAKFTEQFIGEENVVFIIDKEASHLGSKVYLPSEIPTKEFDYILITALGREDEICEVLKYYNISNDKILKFSLIAHKQPDKKLCIGDIDLFVRFDDKGGLAYDSKSSYEEINNYVYRDIQERFSPDYVFDIGANYGYTSIVFTRYFLQAQIVLVEGSSTLIPYIETNLKANHVKNKYQIIHAVCGQEDSKTCTFSLNPAGSQDNRVIAPSETWEVEKTSMINLDKLFRRYPGNFYFIKMDTQGYEEHIFAGGRNYLSTHHNWIIKTEFAPISLRSQGTDPYIFLKTLISLYDVSEIPHRSRYRYDNLDAICSRKLTLADIEPFIEYIQKHNKCDRGWCDLYVYPKGLV